MTENEREITYIKGFVSYEDYLKFPALTEYVDNKNITLPDRCLEIMGKKNSVVSEVQSVTEKKRKTNGIAVTTIILGLLFIAWIVVGYFLGSGNYANLFEVGGEKSIVENVLGLINGKYQEILSLINVILQVVVVVFMLMAVIGGFVNAKSNGTGAAMKIGTFLMFVVAVVVASLEIKNTATIQAGTSVMLIITLLVFFINIIAKKKIK